MKTESGCDSKNRTRLILRYFLGIMAIVLCQHVGNAQTMGEKKLTSFCGFKAGEIKKSEKGISKTISPRSPFRKFRDVLLQYAPDDRLRTVIALAFFDNKTDDVRKEAELCCTELARYGIQFQDWDIKANGNWLVRKGSGDGVDVDVFTCLAAENGKKKASRIQISVTWRTVGDPRYITPRSGEFKVQGNLTRKAFVENVFGMRFGEEIKSGSRKLSSPICGLTDISTFSDPESGKLRLIRLHGEGGPAKKSADVEPKFARLCNEVKTWLAFDRYDKENEEMYNNTARYIDSTYRDKTLKVAVEVMWNPKWEMSHFTVIISDSTSP